ncbi:MAG: Holliday junction branch migration protein RuvA [Acidobacteriota bacterium]|nr:Holliday junction branch migration protein RuvA [Blastocatellia bacterium]MDW8412672.1 Holliday junction branch migration protein RuvA [Acidobacteriota bacterium]
MIAYLCGKVLYKEANLVVLEVNGVGYELHVPLSTYYELSESELKASFYVHTYVREDAIQLFGFRTRVEKELFLRLIGVSGIGPKLALAILSGLSVEELVEAVASSDLSRLMSVPGVGRRTAERLAVELRGRVENLGILSVDGDKSRKLRSDLVSALVNLGWQQSAVEKAVDNTIRHEQRQDFEWLLKQAMKRLYSR